MGFSKYSMLVLLAVVFLAVLWQFGRSVFTGVTKWLLWALGAVCASKGMVFLVTSEGKPLPIVDFEVAGNLFRTPGLGHLDLDDRPGFSGNTGPILTGPHTSL